MGYLPGMIWLLAGVVLAGAGAGLYGAVCLYPPRRPARWVSWSKRKWGPTAGVIALIATFMIMVIILAVLGDDRGESG
ncbi:Carbon starvation protein A [Kluyvera cryocrescens]|uniref:Carbon starvation protein A n=1 Tax=Kluyvera cryocrescens TaxID=580 RepID=A0A485CJL7_KLUCR|nr:Carbon starvation protein A [Kluyvera cryocrescens]